MKGALSSPVSAALQDGFGCAVTNRFQQLLDDESDPLDILRQAEEERARRKRKEESKKPGPAGSAASRQQPPSQKNKETQKDRRLPSTPAAPPPGQKQAPKRPEWDGQNENWGTEIKVERAERRTAFREFRPNEMEGPVEFAVEKPFDRWDRERTMRGRGGVRGGGMRGRGRGGGFVKTWDGGVDQRGKREFERHSGSDRTGIRAEDKKGGSGAHNWGTVKDDLSDMEQTTPMEETTETDEHHEAIEGEPETRVIDETVEVAAQEMTLDEWKSLQAQVRPKLEFNIRKPDSSVPSKAVVIHKSKYKDDDVKEDDDDDEHHYFRKPANDITSQLDINFGSLSRPGRGNRGGARGGGRGRIKKPEGFIPEVVHIEVHSPSLAPNPDDPEDFPALA
ncbi:intracellular hyaluronan-binding protein 4 isoform X2 [Ambystoma mexicanum]|uniref:intracellular hyaluronan-binding protein 4 isoform X2 n=1 Tax=Ambystoma mexicanum TaxID=8296 RepID=UPI0037E73635